MGRKSSIQRLPPEQRRYIERLLREDRLTLDEMLEAIREKFPDAAELPSRSSMGRYKQVMDALTERIRGQREVARMFVAEIGENPDDKSGEMLVQTITALANDVALRAAGKGDLAIDEVRKLSRAVKDVIAARSSALKERKAIQQAAREAMAAEQAEALATVAKRGGLGAEAVELIRKQILGIG